MNLMEYTVFGKYLTVVVVVFLVFFFSSVQKFAGANKLQQSGNRSMSYLAGKAERCVVSLLSSLWWSVFTPVPRSYGQSITIVLNCCGSLSACLMGRGCITVWRQFKRKKEGGKESLVRINAIKDKSGWEVWNVEVKVCVNKCGSRFLGHKDR